MISSSFDYSAPETVADAVAILARTPGSRPLAGGHDILTQLRFRKIGVSHLVDLRKIRKLREITPANGATRQPLLIGAMATLAEIARNPEIRDSATVLAEAADSVGDVQTRNAATIGGSLASEEGANDVVAALVALEAMAHVESARGARVVACADLWSAQGSTLHIDGELIVAVEIPSLPAAAGSAYAKFKNVANNFPICGVAAILGVGAGGKIDHSRLAVTGATARTQRLTAAENALMGAAASGIDGPSAGLKGAECVSDIFASGDYRAHLADVLAAEAVRAAIARIPAGQ